MIIEGKGRIPIVDADLACFILRSGFGSLKNLRIRQINMEINIENKILLKKVLRTPTTKALVQIAIQEKTPLPLGNP